MREMRSAYRFLIRRPGPLSELGVDGRLILKWINKK
jgi:hypothetical protein